jgi:hypothetical protein
MRWQEQVTVTTYEMQWTVRYFLYLSQKWEISAGTGFPTGPPSTTFGTYTNSTTGPSSGNIINPMPVLSSGAIAYGRRKKAMWEDLMSKADRIFTRFNPAYESPL